MSTKDVIEQKLADNIQLSHLEVVDESSNHNVPKGSESHFKVVLVSDEFQEQKLIQRHRRVNKVLSHELSHSIHALAIHTYTEVEWRDKFGIAPLSPPCLGGSASET